LVVSQFTLYADTKRGNRPSFSQAATPLKAEQLYQHYTQELSKQGIPVKTGIFHSHMLVNIANDGPVTILLESR
ncbi:MAG: D-aminoacyl-tRNA deacylase, partial [Clostridiales bacterium]